MTTPLPACDQHGVLCIADYDDALDYAQYWLSGRFERGLVADYITELAVRDGACCPAAGYGRYLMSVAFRELLQREPGITRAYAWETR